MSGSEKKSHVSSPEGAHSLVDMSPGRQTHTLTSTIPFTLVPKCVQELWEHRGGGQKWGLGRFAGTQGKGHLNSACRMSRNWRNKEREGYPWRQN